jgi:enoyl-CoA hydratase
MGTDTGAELVTFKRVDDHIAIVTLDRPAKKNAINGAMTERLEALGRNIESDPNIWVAVLASSSYEVFCSGADLTEVAAGRQDSLVTLEGGFAGFVRAPKSKPWIAAMDGHALAGGLEIGLSCHMRVVGERALLGLPEPRYGMIAGAGGVDRLPRLVAAAVAIELLCTGGSISASRAYEIGLVNAVVAPGAALGSALSIARKICRNAPLAVQASLKFAELTSELPHSELVRQMTFEQKKIYASRDFSEGTQAFIQRREPVWSGS